MNEASPEEREAEQEEIEAWRRHREQRRRPLVLSNPNAGNDD